MSGQSVDSLKQLQKSFFGQLTGKDSDVVKHIQSTQDRTAAERLHIYTSGYRLRLKEAIKTDFDRLLSYLGDDLFERMMDGYIDCYQSRHTSLRFYSQHLIKFLQVTEPFSLYPEIIEIAQIEQAFNDSFDAADKDTITIDKLSFISAEAWEQLTIKFHPSVQLLNLKTNSFLIWKALADEQQPPELVNEDGSWLVWRRELVSRFKAMPDAEACTVKLALQGQNFARMCLALNEFFDEEESPLQMIIFLQGWIEEKIVCNLS